MTIVEMCVHMDCSGCEAKIRKALQKLQGVDDVEIDMARQRVTVTGYVDQKKILKAVRKTGRRAVLWPYPYGAAEHQNFSHHYYQQHHPGHGHHPMSFTSNPTSYNYYKHGYDDYRVQTYFQPATHSTVSGNRAGDIFSDENPNACSVM